MERGNQGNINCTIWWGLRLMILFQESYPDLPNYNGNKYIFYETAKVRDAPEVEDAADEEEETDSSESDSSDDSSDSDVDA